MKSFFNPAPIKIERKNKRSIRTKFNGEFSEKHLRIAIENQIEDITNHLNKTFNHLLISQKKGPMPIPSFDKWISGRTAGYSRWSRFTNRLSVDFNLEILKHNFEDFMKDTIIHEVCHSFDFHLNGRGVRGQQHGYNWQRFMIGCGVSPDRTHNYDISHLINEGTPLFKCGCREGIALGPNQTKKQMRSEKPIYHCRKCRQSIVFDKYSD